MAAGNEKIIAIFGSGKTPEDDPVFEFAESIGRALASAGFTIINGGYNGTMLASAKGATSVGGKVTGVTCTAFGRSGANKYVTDEISTNTLLERLNTLIDTADAYVVLPGGTGTLLELAHIWEFKNKRFADPAKPIIIAGSFWKPLLDILESIDPGCSYCVLTVETPEEIVEVCEKL